MTPELHALQLEQLAIAEFSVAGERRLVAISAPNRFARQRAPIELVGIDRPLYRAVLTIDGVGQSALWSRQPSYCDGNFAVFVEKASDLPGFWCRRCGALTDVLLALMPGVEACERCSLNRMSFPMQTFLLEYRGQLLEVDPQPTRSRPDRVPLYQLRAWKAPWKHEPRYDPRIPAW